MKYAIIILLFLSCSQTVEPTLDISGRYSSNEGMIMLINHEGNVVAGVLEHFRGTTELKGLFDKKNGQLIITGWEISFNLIYGSDKSLRGGYTTKEGSRAIAFTFNNTLQKQSEGQ